MTSDTIEELSVSAVKTAIAKTGILEAGYINSKDKKPTWDGDVLIYESPDSRRKAGLKKVSVQIKGKQKDSFPDTIKEDVDIDDLKNYADNMGAIYFVVYVTEDCQTKIYYQTFTPVKIYRLLEGCEEQGTKKILFNQLPTEASLIASIFMNFHHNSIKQSSFSKENMLSFEGLRLDKDITEVAIHFVGYGYDRIDLQQALFDNEIYFYAKKKGIDQLIPVNVLPKTRCIEEKPQVAVTTNGKKHYDTITIRRTKDEEHFIIGKSIIFSTAPNACTKIVCHFSDKLKDKIVDLNFFISMIEANGFELNGVRFDINSTDDEKKKILLEKAKKELTDLKDIKAALEYLHVQKDIELSKLTDDEWAHLYRLVAAFVKKEKFTGLSDDIPRVVKLTIQDITILLLCVEDDSQKGTYIVRDYFDPGLIVLYKFEEIEEDFVASVYSGLKPEEFNLYDNINYDGIVSVYDNRILDNPELPGRALYDTLNLLTAFDQSGNIKQLKAAEGLWDWVITKSEIESAVAIINKLQIVKRSRPLNEKELLQLSEIIEDTEQSESAKVGAYLLMDNQLLAQKHFSLLSDSEQDEFRDYPIYKRFWKSEV